MDCNGCGWKENKIVCAACRAEAAKHSNKVWAKAHDSHATLQTHHMEQAVQHALEGAEPVCEVHTRCSIQVHSKRKHLADPDGISAKAVIDGLRACGVLIDDSAEYVKEVRFSQEAGTEDETTITVEFE